MADRAAPAGGKPAAAIAAGSESYSGVDVLEVMEEAVNYNAFLRNLVAAEARPSDEILDFGAGSGALARPLAAAGYRIRCVEPDRGLRAGLQAGGLEAHPSLDALPPASLDLAYTVNVLEHIEDDGGAVAALHARLTPGGRLVVYVPAFPILYSSLDRDVGHVRRYRRDELAGLLREAGFAVEHIAYQDSLGFGAALLFKLLDDGSGGINRRALVAYDRIAFPVSRLLDRVCGRWFGKNLVAVARKPAAGGRRGQAVPACATAGARAGMTRVASSATTPTAIPPNTSTR